MQFTDLQINAAGVDKELRRQRSTWLSFLRNILLNGDFNTPGSGSLPENWSTWITGAVAWANHENKLGVTYDGSYYMVVGGQKDAGRASIKRCMPRRGGPTNFRS